MEKIEYLKNLILIHIYDTKSLGGFEIGILKALWKAPDGGSIEDLVEVLKSQGKDNPTLMKRVIGEKAFNLLNNIK